MHKGFRVVKMISILAPTRGATLFPTHLLHRSFISILAPTRGATSYGADAFENHTISILAPTRGATLFACIPCRYRRFQSSLPRGERLKYQA